MWDKIKPQMGQDLISNGTELNLKWDRIKPSMGQNQRKKPLILGHNQTWDMIKCQNSLLIIPHLKRRAEALVHIGIIAAGTGIGSGRQHHSCRIPVCAMQPPDRDLVRLERLAQRVKVRGRVLREFVQKEDAQMGQGDQSGRRHVPSADQGRPRDRVMRRYIGPFRD